MTTHALVDSRPIDRVFEPGQGKDQAQENFHMWKKAVGRAKHWGRVIPNVILGVVEQIQRISSTTPGQGTYLTAAILNMALKGMHDLLRGGGGG